MPYLSLAKYGLPFLAGVLITALYHGYVLRGIEVEKATTVAEQATIVVTQTVKDTRENDANVHLYLEQIAAASQESENLRKRLADGSISLRMCHADTLAARVQASNSDAAKRKAEADFAAYRERVIELIRRGKELDAWVGAAHEFINRP